MEDVVDIQVEWIFQAVHGSTSQSYVCGLIHLESMIQKIGAYGHGFFSKEYLFI